MRSLFVLNATVLALAATTAIAACATSSDEAPPSDTKDGGLDSSTDDGGSKVDAAPDAPEPLSTCSSAGWCATPLPDEDLTFRDIWPLAGRAFAIATSPTLGVRVLEWTPSDDALGRWVYIDDATQNERGYSKYLGRIWAPGADEVYFGVSPGTVYHGIRPAAPATEWAWKRDRLDDHSKNPGTTIGYLTHNRVPFTDYALGVWGTGPGDVYAWYLNTLFHRKSEGGGPPSWVAEYIADDHPGDHQELYFLGAAGTRDDVWFGGSRYNPNHACAFVVRKMAGTFKRVADGTIKEPPPWNPAATECIPKDGVQWIGGAEGWPVDIQSPSPGRVVMLKGGRDVTRLRADGDGYGVDSSYIPWTVNEEAFSSIWASSEEQQWVLGKGIVLRAENTWAGGSFQISTIAMNGAPLRENFYRVRGTSNTNLWAIGAGYALHKTSP